MTEVGAVKHDVIVHARPPFTLILRPERVFDISCVLTGVAALVNVPSLQHRRQLTFETLGLRGDLIRVLGDMASRLKNLY